MILTKEKLEKKPLYYYSSKFNINNWMEVSAAFDELEHKQIETPRDLLSLLYQSGELMNILNEEYNELYFRTLSNTNDTEASRQMQDFVKTIAYPASVRNDEIVRKFHEHPMRLRLNQDSYRQVNKFFDDISTDLDRGTNPGNIEINNLVQEYRRAYNQVQVMINGKSHPLNIISHVLAKAAPGERETIWQSRKVSCLQNKKQFEDILDRLIKARNKMAADYGYKNFYEYSLNSDLMGKTNISQVQEIHKAISNVILPMVKLFIKQRQKRQNLKTLRPWDLEADAEAASLSPFSSTSELGEKAIAILYDIRFEYGILLNKMYNSDMLNLDYSPDKVKGEFYFIMPSLDAGKILMNCTGHHRDVVMLFHEMGHTIQTAILMRNPLALFNVLPVQARELASQTLVYLSTGGWDDFYPDKKDYKTAFRSLFEHDIMQILYWSILNQFELVLYANPDWPAAQREKAMMDLWKQYDWGVDWSGLEDWQSIIWMQELTLFEYPHYSFFSALSIFNVLQIFKNYRHAPLDAISRFQHFLEKVTDLSIDEMFLELDIKQDYSEHNMRKMMDFVLGEYKRIGT